jgi:hypothetical protein
MRLCEERGEAMKFKSLLNSFGTARGSDLMRALCGWPAGTTAATALT